MQQKNFRTDSFLATIVEKSDLPEYGRFWQVLQKLEDTLHTYSLYFSEREAAAYVSAIIEDVNKKIMSL